MNYRFVGWCRDGQHDKVWGVILIRTQPWNSTYAIFWGRRGGKLKTKVADYDEWELEKLISNKIDRGYRQVDREQLNSVYGDFEADLHKTAVWATLKVPHS